MSKYGWERGEIKMSAKEFRSFRLDMVAYYNRRQDGFYVDAQGLYTRLKTAGKGKRNFDFLAAFEQMTERGSVYSNPIEGKQEIFEALFPYESAKTSNRVRKPKAPKKNQFAHLKQSTDSMNVGSEAGISFVKKLRTVIWSVPENNHSVELAHEHPVGQEFFKRLSRVTWTRGTGGEIVGNDEYNQESQSSGGGGNYVTSRYGAAEKEFKQSFRSVRSWK